MNYNTLRLDDGLRIIHRPAASDVVYCGIGIKAGTRDEQSGEEGLAHLCEHLMFKGTSRRTAVQIINAIEGVGGELNAFTNKEDTVYYCAVHRNYFARAIDVLNDIVFGSIFPPQEVEKEREVVCEEIESYEDSPAELIYDEFENLLFSGHPLGHNILGTAAQVRSYGQQEARRFTERHYRPDNAVLFVSGNIVFADLVRQLRSLAALRASRLTDADEKAENSGFIGKSSDKSEEQVARTIVRHRNTHQAHVMLGAKTFPADDRRRWALYLLNNILGGPGLNSRLNLSLRERHGLVYTVDSSMVNYSDTGLWSVYFGCDQADTDKCLMLVERELRRLTDRPLGERQLKAAKQQLHGQLAIAADNREQFTLDFAKNFLHFGRERDLSDILVHIDALTATDLQDVAREVFAPEHRLTLIYQ